jgi:hypothetical protein
MVGWHWLIFAFMIGGSPGFIAAAIMIAGGRSSSMGRGNRADAASLRSAAR